ncbi:ABC transporter ATP-binding protein [Metamycoplasma hominis]|uniref:ABC transporter ATP-binding protein n=1 Tax=Metamycoplasma hominis TaxID=2098 RepID=UPI00158F2B4C|nr:ABC transporter ATP-binding protein [Metamycoplasma hominis]QKX39018.1 ABC transporter ATP-binding protein [Metamycoplasma hominis]
MNRDILDPLKVDIDLKKVSKFERKAFRKKQHAIKSESFKELIKYLNYKRGYVFLIIIITLISSLCLTAATYGLGYIIDHYLNFKFWNSNSNVLFEFGIAIGILILGYILEKVFSFICSAMAVKAGIYGSEIMRSKAYKSIMKMPIQFFDTVSSGELMSILSNDIDNVSYGICGTLNSLLAAIFSALTSLGFMFYYSTYLTLIYIALFPVLLILAFVLIKKAIPLFGKTQRNIGLLNGFVEENLAAHQLINSLNSQQIINEQFDLYNEKLYKPSLKANIYAGIVYPYGNAITFIMQLIIIFVGGAFALSGIGTGSNSNFTVGTLTSFILYIKITSSQIIKNFENISMIQTATISTTRVLNLIRMHPAIDESKLATISNVRGDIEFKNVSFSYDNSLNNLQLKNISFKAKKGQVFAIVGPTGAGKTTIINLLSKFYLPIEGEIKIDDYKSSEINESSWRNQISIVLQDTFLFKTTILENLRYANPSASNEEIINAAKITKADNFIRQLEHGYEEIVEEGGSNFSQGERQMLAITRAIIANKNILILDEATSNVDTRTEKNIQDAMLELMKGKTSFVIAHRLSTIVNASQILVVKDGKIIEQGTHKELLIKGSFYEKLYHSSFSEENE